MVFAASKVAVPTLPHHSLTWSFHRDPEVLLLAQQAKVARKTSQKAAAGLGLGEAEASHG